MAQLKGEERLKYVAEMFARIAHRYDLMNTIMTAGMHHRWRRAAVRLATEGLSGPALDVASGTGDLAIELARSPAVTQAVALDLVPQMLQRARSKARRKGVEAKVKLAVGDALNLPFPDSSFACAAVGFGIRNIPDLTRAIGEMTRVVVPGGRVAILEIVPRSGPWRPLTNLYFRRVIPLMGRLIARDSEAYRYLPDSVEAFPTADGLVHLMEEVGLREVKYQRVAMGTVAIHTGVRPLP